MPLNYSLKMVKMINFRLYIFYGNLFKKRKKESHRTRKDTEHAQVHFH